MAYTLSNSQLRAMVEDRAAELSVKLNARKLRACEQKAGNRGMEWSPVLQVEWDEILKSPEPPPPPPTLDERLAAVEARLAAIEKR